MRYYPHFREAVPHLKVNSYTLLTRLPLVFPEGNLPFDLHALGTPPAFILSQDQTLKKSLISSNILFDQVLRRELNHQRVDLQI
ncbi:hypothetical protein SDC9_156949 [bioreactor metagenome]|jgi:hypothetical protein|uniref:Uncharacterized protein n=1 Tax=bioreactor metagenome TaxID=1076179 RepID=A0A645F5M7_9ZZZZ